MSGFKYTYLFKEGDNFVFMQSETYEQVPIPKEIIGEGVDFLEGHSHGPLFLLFLYLSFSIFVLKSSCSSPRADGHCRDYVSR